MIRRRVRARSLVVFVTAVGLLVTACGDDDSATTTSATDTSMDVTSSSMGDMTEGFAWGMPGDPADAERVVEITASDAFRFDPDSVQVQVGETVTFRITNTGAIDHEFVVGTAAEQDDHEAEMADMGDMEMADDPNAITVAPGETGDLTLTFTAAGPLLFGCHETGHFAAGMVGDLDVQS